MTKKAAPPLPTAIKKPEPVRLPSKEDRIPIREEPTYVLEKEWASPGNMGIVMPGAKFMECRDGWFQIIDCAGHLLWFRVSPQLLQEIKSR